MIEPRVLVADSEVTTDDRNEVVGHKDDLWFETALGDQWVMAFRFALQDGALVVAELRVFPSDGTTARASMDDSARDPGCWIGGETLGIRAGGLVPAGGLPAGLLRDVTFLSARRSAVDIITRNASDMQFGPDGLFGALGLVEVPAKPPKRPGKLGHSDFFYAVLAQRYAELCRGATGRRTVMAQLSSEIPHSERSSVRSMIKRARALGILTPAKHGVASGELTDKGLRTLEEGPKPGKEADVPFQTDGWLTRTQMPAAT